MTGSSHIVESRGTETYETPYETLQKALESIGERLYAPETTGIEADRTPDAEVDRILIWEVAPDGDKTLVWHFSGWFYPEDASDLVPGGLPQGRLPGQDVPLYRALHRGIDCID